MPSPVQFLRGLYSDPDFSRKARFSSARNQRGIEKEEGCAMEWRIKLESKTGWGEVTEVEIAT